MSLVKSDVKLGFMEEIAKKVDSFNKEAEKRATEYDAMAKGFNQAIPKVVSLMEAIDQDLDVEGKLEEIGKEPILVAKYAKEWVKRAVATLQLMGDAAADSARQARGRVSAFGTTLDFLEGLYVKEKLNKQRIGSMLVAGELMAEMDPNGEVLLEESPSKNPDGGNGARSRPAGVRPAPSIAQRRRAEEAAEEAQEVVQKAGAALPLSQKDIPSTAEALPEEPQEAATPPPEEPPSVEEVVEEAPQEAAQEPEEAAPEPDPEPEPEPPKPEPQPEPVAKASPPPKAEPKTPKKRTRRTRAKEKQAKR